MKPIRKHFLDDGSMPDSHFLEIASRLVESIRKYPYSVKQRDWHELLRECGEIMRFRHCRHFADEFNRKIAEEAKVVQ